MSKLIKTLNEFSRDANEILKKGSESVNEAVEPFMQRFNHINTDIYSDFGDYIGKVFKTLNTSRMDSPVYKDRDYPRFAVAKSFGFLFKKDGNINNIHDTALFRCLRNEHISLIKNHRKQMIAREFLSFRDKFLEQLKGLGTEIVVTGGLNIPAQLMKVNRISVKEVGSSNNVFDAYVVNDIEFHKINKMVLYIDFIDAWDPLSEHITVKNDISNSSLSTTLGIRFQHDNLVLGSAGFRIKEKHFISLVTLMTTKSSEYTFHTLSKYPNFCNHDYDGINTLQCNTVKEKTDGVNSVLINLGDVFKDEQVQSVLNKYLRFWETATKAWDYLKLKHAGELIINGNF